MKYGDVWQMRAKEISKVSGRHVGCVDAHNPGDGCMEQHSNDDRATFQTYSILRNLTKLNLPPHNQITKNPEPFATQLDLSAKFLPEKCWVWLPPIENCGQLHRQCAVAFPVASNRPGQWHSKEGRLRV